MMQYLNKKIIPVAIVAVGVLAAGAFVYINQSSNEGGNALSPQTAAEKAMAFINQSIQEENVTASLIDVAEESGLYKVHLKIEETEYNSYITKDGKLLFASAFNLEEQEKTTLPEETASLDDFAKCLTSKGMKVYGSKNCSWCQKQKDLFGDSLQYVVYVECLNPETEEWTEECKTAGIESTPTWLLPDGEKSPGFKSLEQLTELSGCAVE